MSLATEERVIYSTRLSKKLFVKPFLLAGIFFVAAFFSERFGGEFAPYLLWAFVAVGAVLLISPFTKYYLSHFVLTNQRVMIHHGFLTRTSYEMILEKIESITVNQSLADRLLWGSGTLVITGTGGTKEQFPDVGSAVAFQEHLNEALHGKLDRVPVAQLD
jgi:uncharacterized membrane protein YdbT with pleckstrin-like domain